MGAFIARRLLAAFFVVLASSFIVYVMLAYSGDPLAFLIEIQDPERRAAVEATVRENLNLDTPVVGRYFLWLGDVLRGDFGISARTQLPVWDDLTFRVPMTLKLVGAATLLSIVVGISVGIITAIRQYSGFDYLVSFFTFVFFSLPVFWVAVILKNFGGINFNDWLRDSAQFSTTFYVIAGIVRGDRLLQLGRRGAAAKAARDLDRHGGGARDPVLHLGHALAAQPRVRADRDRGVGDRYRCRRHGGHGWVCATARLAIARSPRPASASCCGSRCRPGSTT